MANDPTVRSLSGLANASSSRVLNLAAIAAHRPPAPEGRAAPLFVSPALDSAIILKHRLRTDELDLFTPRRTVATKVIVPFQATDLRSGGRSFLVGQAGFEEMLRDVVMYGERIDMQRDLAVLALIDRAPSLDPFFLRQHLLKAGIAPGAHYFALSPADRESMFEHAARDIRRLTAKAAGGAMTASDRYTAGIVSALLAGGTGEALDPLRMTLRLAESELGESLLGWRGVLYYKWSFAELWPGVIDVLRDVKAIRPAQRVAHDEAAALAGAKQALLVGVKTDADAVRADLGQYDDAFAHLVEQENPSRLREFLLRAPPRFLALGEKIGIMSHIVSFWRYRFPQDAPKTVDARELSMILRDFAQNVGAPASGVVSPANAAA